MRYKRLPIVLIDWVDAYGRGGWHEHLEPGRRIAEHRLPGVGFLVGEDKHSVILSPVADMEEHASEFVIPRAWVRKREVLRIITLPESRWDKE